MNKFINILYLVALITLVSCSKFEPKKVRVKFYNKTGESLKRLIIGDKKVGNLNENAVSRYKAFDYFTFYDNRPSMDLKCEINGKTIINLVNYGFCGTGIESVSTGTYEVDVVLNENVGNYSIYLRNH